MKANIIMGNQGTGRSTDMLAKILNHYSNTKNEHMLYISNKESDINTYRCWIKPKSCRMDDFVTTYLFIEDKVANIPFFLEEILTTNSYGSIFLDLNISDLDIISDVIKTLNKCKITNAFITVDPINVFSIVTDDVSIHTHITTYDSNSNAIISMDLFNKSKETDYIKNLGGSYVI